MWLVRANRRVFHNDAPIGADPRDNGIWNGGGFLHIVGIGKIADMQVGYKTIFPLPGQDDQQALFSNAQKLLHSLVQIPDMLQHMGTNDDIKGIVRKRDIFHGAADKGIAVGLGEIFGLLYIQPVYGVSG